MISVSYPLKIVACLGVILSTGLLANPIQSAKAATVTLIQEWAFSPTNTFITGARWDTTGLTGIGTEFFFLERFTATQFMGGTPQFSAVAQFTSPQSLVLPGNTVATYVNGAFRQFGNTQVPGGGNPVVSLAIEASGFPAGGYGWDGIPGLPQFAYFAPVSGITRYNLVSSEFVTPPAIPLPAAFPLLATGLGFVSFLGWRRRRKVAAAS